MAEEDDFLKRDERVPQSSQQETREFIAIRAELETDFTTTKRNKTLWEIVAAKMSERGYRLTPDQCKCKWKNLVYRYKFSYLLKCMLYSKTHLENLLSGEEADVSSN